VEQGGASAIGRPDPGEHFTEGVGLRIFGRGTKRIGRRRLGVRSGQWAGGGAREWRN